MRILFNLVISAVVAIVFVVFMANARNIPQNPVAYNRSTLIKPNARQSLNISLQKSHIDGVKMPTTNVARSFTWISPTFFNHTTTRTFVKGTAKKISAYTTSNEKMTMVQSMKKFGLETITERNKSTTTPPPSFGGSGFIGYSASFPTRNDNVRPSTLIDVKRFTCQDGYTVNTNGGCEPIFFD
uniref:Uncharacterized protein n=1 Tax=Schizaphis graminum TaxID=13262 RepID=A0A2S2P223_SCHGA